MSPGALCQGRRQRSPSMLRPTGVQGQPMVGVDGAGAKWSQSRSMFGALSRPALVLLAARRRRPGVTKPWRTESRYTVNKFVADPPRPPPGIPDWPNSPTPARLGHPRRGQRPAPTRRPSTTWPATHTWLPSPEPTTPERRRSERRWPAWRSTPSPPLTRSPPPPPRSTPTDDADQPHIPVPRGDRRSASPNLSRSPRGPLRRLRRPLAPAQNPRIVYDRPGRPKGPSRGTQGGASLAQMATTGRPAPSSGTKSDRDRPSFCPPGAVVLFARGTSLATSAG